MKTTALFVIACVVASTFATTDLFAEIKSTHFGENLVKVIEI